MLSKITTLLYYIVIIMISHIRNILLQKYGFSFFRKIDKISLDVSIWERGMRFIYFKVGGITIKVGNLCPSKLRAHDNVTTKNHSKELTDRPMQMSYHERRSQGRKKGLFLFKFSSTHQLNCTGMHCWSLDWTT